MTKRASIPRFWVSCIALAASSRQSGYADREVFRAHPVSFCGHEAEEQKVAAMHEGIC